MIHLRRQSSQSVIPLPQAKKIAHTMLYASVRYDLSTETFSSSSFLPRFDTFLLLESGIVFSCSCKTLRNSLVISLKGIARRIKGGRRVQSTRKDPGVVDLNVRQPVTLGIVKVHMGKNIHVTCLLAYISMVRSRIFSPNHNLSQ